MEPNSLRKKKREKKIQFLSTVRLLREASSSGRSSGRVWCSGIKPEAEGDRGSAKGRGGRGSAERVNTHYSAPEMGWAWAARITGDEGVAGACGRERERMKWSRRD